MAVDPFAERLRVLLSEGSIVASALSTPMRKRLESLFFTKALHETKAGGGRRVEIRDREAVERWLLKQYPSGLAGTTEKLPPRAEAVANFRDSKAGRSLEIRPMFMRGFGATILTRTVGMLPLAALTTSYDVVGVLVFPSGRAAWQLSGVLALVENFELFMHVERVVPGIDAALWTAGRVDQRVLDWIGAMPACRVLHAGDYDPVGLDEYLRTRQALPAGRASLFIPDNLEQLLIRYGTTDLLTKSVAVLERVRREAPPEVREVLALMDRHHRALEQEALLIGLASSQRIAEDGV